MAFVIFEFINYRVLKQLIYMSRVYGYSGNKLIARGPKGKVTYATFHEDLFDRIETDAAFQRAAPTIMRWYVESYGIVPADKVKTEDINPLRYIVALKVELNDGPAVTLTSRAHSDTIQSVLYTVSFNNRSFVYRGLEAAITKVNELCGDWWMLVRV